MNILKLCLREVGEGAHFKRQLLLPKGVQFSHELFWGGVKCKVLHHIQKTPTPLFWDILNNHSLFLHYAFKALGISRVCTEV